MNMTLEEYVLKFSGYAINYAKYYCKILYDMNLEFDDLYQAGCLALVESYYKYDSSKSSPSTHANTMVRFGILDYINKNTNIIRIPDVVNLVVLKLIRKKHEYYKIYGRNMTTEEITDYVINECDTGTYTVDENYIKTLLEIECLYMRNTMYSLDESIDKHSTRFFNIDCEKDDICIKEVLNSKDNVEEKVINEVFVSEILSYVENRFSEMDLDIFKESFGLVDGIAKSHNKIGKKYGFSNRASNQRYQKVLKQVKRKFSNLG